MSNEIVRIKAVAPFAGLRNSVKLARINKFAQALIQHAGKHALPLQPDSPSLVETALLARGIKRVLVSEGAKPEVAATQLAKLLKVKNPQATSSCEPAILFNG